jgi:hypothetical protein
MMYNAVGAAAALDLHEAPLRKGFQAIPGVEGRRFRSKQFSEEVEVAGEITAPADVSGTLPSDRSSSRPALVWQACPL